jgi:ADP-ribose pyrophosphatase YjhB (NUDIX family)
MNQIISILDNYAYRTLVWDIYVERVARPASGVASDEEKIAAALPKAEVCLSALDELMADAPWLTGPTISLADLHAAPIFAAFLRTPEGQHLVSRHDRLARWWDRVSTRPSFVLTQVPPRHMSIASETEPRWLTIARELQAMSQTGLHYTKDKYDAERFARLRVLASEMLALHSDAPFERIVGLFSGDIGYSTPKIDVRGAIFRDSKILMVREVSDGRWSLPGGWADVNRSISQSVAREIFEERGFTTHVTKLVAAWDRSLHGHRPVHPYSVLKLFFLCKLTGGTATSSEETSEVGFFGEDELPELSIGRVQTHQIRRMFAHHCQPDLPTEFD